VKRALWWLGLALSLACLGFFLHSAASHWHAVEQMNWRAGTFLLATAALALYLTTYSAAGLAWQASLRMLGISARAGVLCRVLMLSQFGKYLPGNLAHHAGRVVLARKLGIGLEPTVASMAIDMAILLVVAVGCSLPALGVILAMLRGRDVAFVGPVAAVLVPCLAAVCLAWFFSQRVRRLVAHPIRVARTVLVRGNIRFLLRATLAHCLGFVLGGSALYLLCGAFSGSFSGPLPGVVGVYTASWLLGFLVIGAPAGIGIREVALMFGLTPLFGEQPALAATVVLRIVTTLGDGLLFAAALGLAKSVGQRDS
jgi:uncharacterized membrane protein YbhN (UPF0104 family)